MAYPKYYRDTKMDKICDKIRPIIRAKLVAGEYGKRLNDVEQLLTPQQQSQQQLLRCLDNCRQEIAFYTALENIYQERYRQSLESTSCLPHNTSLKKSGKVIIADRRLYVHR